MGFQLIRVPSLIFLAFFALQSASATAIFEVQSEATLSIESTSNITNMGDLSGLTITGLAELNEEFADFGGNGLEPNINQLLFPDLPTTLVAGDSVQQLAGVFGTADPFGFSDAFILTDGFIDLENESTTDTYVIDFLLTYSLHALASADLAAEFAIAIASVFVYEDFFSFGDPEDFFDDIDTDSFESPGPADIDNSTYGFSVTLAPDSFQTVAVGADADGFAESLSVPIPVPPSLALLATGLALIGWSKRLSIR